MPDRYILVTLHRPSNVDDLDWLNRMVQVLSESGTETPVIFPVHPRTRQRLAEAGGSLPQAIAFASSSPLPYITFLGVPCLTVRENTERPITVECGTNVLFGRDLGRLRTEMARVVAGKSKRGQVPPLWDGRAAERIAGRLDVHRNVASSIKCRPHPVNR